MSSSVNIRVYRDDDRPLVRAIACDTAARGEPVEEFFHDRRVFADLLTRYYTDWEPQALWVAEVEGRVAGYLTGCLNGRRYARTMAWRIVPQALLEALRRGALAHSNTWRLFWAAVRTWQLHGFQRRRLNDYPAHLHVNLRRECRGRGIGERLVRCFLEQAMSCGVTGVHVGIRSDNPPARRLFERLGFVELSRHPVVFPSGPMLQRRETILYGKRL